MSAEVDGIVEEEGYKWMEVDEHLEEQSGIQDLRQVGQISVPDEY